MSDRLNSRPIFASLVLALLLSSKPAVAGIAVPAAAKPGGEWINQETRTLDDLPPIPADSGLSRFGGRTAHMVKANGFFYTTNILDRWWLVDPEGCLFLNVGVASIKMIPTSGARAALESKFGSQSNWAARTKIILRENGFNGFGAWTDLAALGASPGRMVYTTMSDFMSAYGRKRGGTFQQSGHIGYPNDCIFIFDPAFESFCDEYAKQFAALKDDPWLLGHFSDNELPFKVGMITNYLALPENDPGRIAAWEFLRSRHGPGATVKDVTERDKRDFLSLVAQRYLRLVSTAIRKYDPNHLYLGPRLHGVELLRTPEFFKAIGPFVDVVSVNYYRVWSPTEQPAMWSRESDRPVLVTEWYAKGADSGMGNTSGAGWLVRTQRERGMFYQNFTLCLLETKACIGWHWFRYSDNDPADRSVDPSNRDSNKGIVNNRYEPYGQLLDAMRLLNQRVYSLADHFDQVDRRSAGEKGD